MDQRIERLKEAAAVINDLEKAAALLSWDEETKMPPGGAEARAEQRATLHRLAHERLIADAEPVDDSFLRRGLPIEPQRRFSAWALQKFGVDCEHWRLDDTVHPFASSTSSADIRITTRFRETDLGGVLACFHEFGHGLYERQIAPELGRTPLGSGVSAALH